MIIQDHNTNEYKIAQARLKSGKFNGAYFYSKEIVDCFIPKIKTSYNWQTINHQTAPEHCIVFVHSNNALYRYDYLLTYRDIILVCSTHNSVKELKKKGHKKVVYVPLSIDTEYLSQFKNEYKNGTIAAGNLWAFTPQTKQFFIHNGIKHYHDVEREDLLRLISKSETVYAIGRTAMEAIYLGANVIQPDKEYPVEKYTTYFTQKKAISILKRHIKKFEKKRIKTVVGIATFKGREPYLAKALESLQGQADYIHVWDNNVEPVDLTDNGKFYFLKLYKEPVYYFSCDDDITYPPTYIADMVAKIDQHGCIVTHHGRKLRGLDLSYYRGHEMFHWNYDNKFEGLIDVAGTGVTGFRTDYFNPIDIWKSPDKRMSDLVFSLEAAKQRKRIVVLQHGHGYLKYLNVPAAQTIHGTEANREHRQIEIANEIWKLH
jgi:hypothetical protein